MSETSEKIDSSLSSLENSDNLPDVSVTRMINGKPTQVKVEDPRRRVGRRQQHLRKSEPLRYPAEAILNAAAHFDQRDPALAFSNVDSDDLRLGHKGPQLHWSALVINTGLDSFDFLAWFRDSDFDSFPRSDATQSRGSLLERLGFSSEYSQRHLQADS